MTWILAILGSKWGRMAGLGAVALAAILAAGVYGYVKGRTHEAAKLATVTAQLHAAQDANVGNLDTIAGLKAANANWAAQAAEDKARAAKAVQSLTEQRKALTMQLSASQAKLRSIENEPAVKTWASECIPGSVLDALGLHPATTNCQNPDRDRERSRDRESAQGIDAAGAGAATAD